MVGRRKASTSAARHILPARYTGRLNSPSSITVTTTPAPRQRHICLLPLALLDFLTIKVVISSSQSLQYLLACGRYPEGSCRCKLTSGGWSIRTAETGLGSTETQTRATLGRRAAYTIYTALTGELRAGEDIRFRLEGDSHRGPLLPASTSRFASDLLVFLPFADIHGQELSSMFHPLAIHATRKIVSPSNNLLKLSERCGIWVVLTSA